MKSTDKELVSILQTAKLDPRFNRSPSTVYRLNRMIESARNGEYHDFKSNDPHPKLTLSIELRTLGMDAVALAVEGGEFDER